MADGYEFLLHRIPKPGNHPVLLVHGLLTSSLSSILLGPRALNAFLVLCSVHPEYNERILLMQALAPIVQLHGRKPKIIGELSVNKCPEVNKPEKSNDVIEDDEEKDPSFHCKPVDNKLKIDKVNKFLTKIGEPPIKIKRVSSASLKEIKHLQQIWDSGDFVAFHYDVEGNRKCYNSVEPYNYNLNLIISPHLLYFIKSDAIATLVLNAVAGVYRLYAVKFNHIDFLCVSDVKTLVNDRVIAMMEQHLAGKLSYVIE
ncbi:lipase 1 [Bactrocera oleae]|uniref:lipase 1 n=1 Tax=Bactrocera oleae TaxID=104688 RepID=UPI00387E9654